MSVAHMGEYEREEAETREQRALGFWLYLMGDAVIFALLFATYAIMIPGTAGGPTGKDLFDLNNAALETVLLLVSSTTFGFASLLVRTGNRSAVLGWLAVTFLLGAGFVFLEVREFAGMIAKGAGPDRSGFLSAFFALVGTHGLHVTFGVIWIFTMMVQVTRHGLIAANQRRLMCLSLFWHFLDVIWIGVFTFVYLMGMLR